MTLGKSFKRKQDNPQPICFLALLLNFFLMKTTFWDWKNRQKEGKEN